MTDWTSVNRPILLVVDDDEGTRTLLETVFRKAGFDVRLAGSGHEGLELLSRIQPEAIIADVVMPEMTGYELCKRVRSAGRTDIPFLFCSGLTDPPERIEGLRLGADDYIAKPILIEELVIKVQSLVERARTLQALARTAAERPDDAALRGRLEEVGVPSLLQLIDFLFRNDACLVLESKDGRTGSIWTAEGKLLHAETGDLLGRAAFYRMLVWSAGTFRIERRLLTAAPTLTAKIDASLVAGLAYLDECERQRESAEALESV